MSGYPSSRGEPEPRRPDPRRPGAGRLRPPAAALADADSDRLPHALAIAVRTADRGPEPVAVLHARLRRGSGVHGERPASPPTIDGLRVRQRPGLASNVVAGLLPLGAELQVVMGPIPTDELGWYLVTDADPADPEFGEGWIAAGFEPDAWLAPTGETAGETPVPGIVRVHR